MKPLHRVARATSLPLFVLVVGLLAACDGGEPTDPGVEPPAPEQLAFQTQPTATQAGDVIDPPVTVRVLDAAGNLVNSAQTTVVMSIESNPGGASLSGTTSVTASAGVATFADLSLDQAGTGYTLRASAAGLTAATSSAFEVTLSPLDQDNDGDGYTPNQGDCDDSDAARNPGEDDRPDAAFIDSNCDGIDGDASLATFVAGSGADAAGCGAMGSPCATVQAGIDEAVAAGTRDVYVMAGTYDDGAVALADGVSLYGGYGPSWVRDGTDTTHVLGSTGVEVATGASEAVTLVADGITQQTVVADLVIEGPDATGALPDGAGRSSYAVWVRSSGSVLTLERNTIIGGAGAPGQDGAAGQSAPTLQATSGMNGSPGGPAQQYSTACDDTSRGAGGGPGMNAGSGLNPAGGAGGNGGTMDEDCSGLFNALTALNGMHGADAAYAAASYGQGGAGGAGSDVCGPGQNGQNGVFTNGSPGAGAPGGGRLAGVLWAARNGGSGGVGQNGSGGGGGGGSGGCDTGIDAYGAGGGGGGAGGLRALSGGGGGGGGGGSFGIYLVDSAPNVLDNTFLLGTGGAGGTGGIGGQGQSGGIGGFGGPGDGGAAAGGRGGDGAHGGHGGGGGGGAGGIAAAIFHSAGFAPNLSGNTFEGGTAGPGGQGGASAPSAPPAEDDGNDGQPGAAGTVANVAAGT